MNSEISLEGENSHPVRHNPKGARNGLAWLLVGLGLVCLMPTNQSLWIDEGFSLSYADEPTATALVNRILTSPGGEPLMPFGMLSIWTGSKVFGRSELGLRASSVLWAAVAVFLMWRVGLLVGMPWLATIFACHAFLWYYASEARPYAMTIAMSTGLLYSLVAVVSPTGNQHRGAGAFLFFGALLCATHALATIPFVFVAMIVANALISKKWKPRSGWLVASLAPVAALAVLAAYYLPAFLKDERVLWREQWAFAFDSALFSAYELLGFMGFGPGRSELRDLAIEGGLRGVFEGLLQPSSLGLVFLTGIYCVIIGVFLGNLRTGISARARLVLVSFLVVAGTMVVAIIASHFLAKPFWGRHLASLLPYVVFASVLAGGVSEKRHHLSPHPLVSLLAVGLLLSSLFVRFDSAHSRDDYRSAAYFASEAANRGETVWWAADPGCAEYYGVEFCKERPGAREQDCSYYLSNRDPFQFVGVPAPDFIVVSKPDLHDIDGRVRRFAVDNDYRELTNFVAFRVFQPNSTEFLSAAPVGNAPDR